MLWCWRCRAVMPMLDDDEFRSVTGKRLLQDVKMPLREQLAPVLEEYNRVTGSCETNVNAVYHHKLSMYGPPCAKCGKPLRTPRARLCGSSMHPVESAA
jgi:hypothetical protein